MKALSTIAIVLIAGGGLASASLCATELEGRGATSEPTCARWVDQVLKRVGRVREDRWRHEIIAAMADARCAAIPVALRDAAAQVRGGKDTIQGDRVLADASAAVLGERCAGADVESYASVLAVKCPLPARPELALPGSVFGDILVADYLVVNALATGFVARNQLDAAAKRLLMDFILSAGLRGERVREAKRARSPK